MFTIVASYDSGPLNQKVTIGQDINFITDLNEIRWSKNDDRPFLLDSSISPKPAIFDKKTLFHNNFTKIDKKSVCWTKYSDIFSGDFLKLRM